MSLSCAVLVAGQSCTGMLHTTVVSCFLTSGSRAFIFCVTYVLTYIWCMLYAYWDSSVFVCCLSAHWLHTQLWEWHLCIIMCQLSVIVWLYYRICGRCLFLHSWAVASTVSRCLLTLCYSEKLQACDSMMLFVGVTGRVSGLQKFCINNPQRFFWGLRLN